MRVCKALVMIIVALFIIGLFSIVFSIIMGVLTTIILLAFIWFVVKGIIEILTDE